MKREEATETPAPTPSRLTTLVPTVGDVIEAAYWTFVYPDALARLLLHLLHPVAQGPIGGAGGVD
jgi:hypothetical protein